MSLPINVLSSRYEIKPPLVKKSRLTSVRNGGIGKNLSDGYVINYAIGCTFRLQILLCRWDPEIPRGKESRRCRAHDVIVKHHDRTFLYCGSAVRRDIRGY